MFLVQLSCKLSSKERMESLQPALEHVASGGICSKLGSINLNIVKKGKCSEGKDKLMPHPKRMVL
jgi:hypothetical protein